MNPLTWAPVTHYTTLPQLDETFPLKGEVKRSGIYIWGFKDDKGLFWPYYVGKHRNVPFRLCEHVSNLKGAGYTLYRPEDLFTFSDNKSYQPHFIRERIDLIAGNRPELQKDLDNMLSRFHYTYLFINDFKDVGDEFEYAVINSIKREVLCNVRGRKPASAVDLGNLNELIDKKFMVC